MKDTFVARMKRDGAIVLAALATAAMILAAMLAMPAASAHADEVPDPYCTDTYPAGGLVNKGNYLGYATLLEAEKSERPGYEITSYNVIANGKTVQNCKIGQYAVVWTLMSPAPDSHGEINQIIDAVGTPLPSTLSYNANGGTGTLAPQTAVTDATEVAAASAFTRSGYTFAGWNTAANGSGTAYTAGASVKLPPVGVTLYAQWTKNASAPSTTPNGGSATPTARQTSAKNAGESAPQAGTASKSLANTGSDVAVFMAVAIFAATLGIGFTVLRHERSNK